MILNVLQPLLDYDGVTQAAAIATDMHGVEVSRKNLTLRNSLFQALDGDTQSLPDDEKMMCFRLLSSIMVDDEVKLTTEEAAFIKKRSAAVNPALPHGRICEAIEKAASPEEE